MTKHKGTSAKGHIEVGSGSRPGKSKHKIESSAPAHPHKIRGKKK